MDFRQNKVFRFAWFYVLPIISVSVATAISWNAIDPDFWLRSVMLILLPAFGLLTLSLGYRVQRLSLTDCPSKGDVINGTIFFVFFIVFACLMRWRFEKMFGILILDGLALGTFAGSSRQALAKARRLLHH